MPLRPPEGSVLSAPFWEAAARGELLVCRCDACAHRFFIPEPACPACTSTRWSWVPSPGRGTLYSYSVVHRGADPTIPVPYVLAAIDLDDGWSMLTRLVDVPARLAVGMPVEVRFTPIAGPGTPTIPTFAVVGEPTAERTAEEN